MFQELRTESLNIARFESKTKRGSKYIKVTVVWSPSEFKLIFYKFSLLFLSGWDTKSLLKSLAGKISQEGLLYLIISQLTGAGIVRLLVSKGN